MEIYLTNISVPRHLVKMKIWLDSSLGLITLNLYLLRYLQYTSLSLTLNVTLMNVCVGNCPAWFQKL